MLDLIKKIKHIYNYITELALDSLYSNLAIKLVVDFGSTFLGPLLFSSNTSMV